MSLCCTAHSRFLQKEKRADLIGHLRGRHVSWIRIHLHAFMRLFSWSRCTRKSACSLPIKFCLTLESADAVRHAAVVISNNLRLIEGMYEKACSSQSRPDGLLHQCILATHTQRVMSLKLSLLAFLWTNALSQSNAQQQFVTCSRQVCWTLGFTVNGWSWTEDKRKNEP